MNLTLILFLHRNVLKMHRNPASQRKGKSRIWDSKTWSRVPRDSDPKISAPVKASSNCKRQTRPLVRESAPYKQSRNCRTVIKIWSQAPDGCFIPRQTGRLTVVRNIRLRTKSFVNQKWVSGRWEVSRKGTLNQVSRSRRQARETRREDSRSPVSLRQSFIVSCCKWLWLREIVKEVLINAIIKSKTPYY
jgi:hypothetical protein